MIKIILLTPKPKKKKRASTRNIEDLTIKQKLQFKQKKPKYNAILEQQQILKNIIQNN